jgi:hypothetical protein
MPPYRLAVIEIYCNATVTQLHRKLFKVEIGNPPRPVVGQACQISRKIPPRPGFKDVVLLLPTLQWWNRA